MQAVAAARAEHVVRQVGLLGLNGVVHWRFLLPSGDAVSLKVGTPDGVGARIPRVRVLQDHIDLIDPRHVVRSLWPPSEVGPVQSIGRSVPGATLDLWSSSAARIFPARGSTTSISRVRGSAT